MNEKLKQVAKAMADAVALNYDNNEAIFNLYARVAIDTLREPTDAMIDAGTNTFRAPDYADAEQCYQAMIDEVLK